MRKLMLKASSTILVPGVIAAGLLVAGGGAVSAEPATTAIVGATIFDATGARLRQAPFTRERVKAAVAASRTA